MSLLQARSRLKEKGLLHKLITAEADGEEHALRTNSRVGSEVRPAAITGK